jgi:hypothetical protein
MTSAGRCGSYFGQVFPDRPPPTCQRDCLNSVPRAFTQSGTSLPDALQRARRRPDGPSRQLTLAGCASSRARVPARRDRRTVRTAVDGAAHARRSAKRVCGRKISQTASPAAQSFHPHRAIDQQLNFRGCADQRKWSRFAFEYGSVATRSNASLIFLRRYDDMPSWRLSNAVEASVPVGPSWVRSYGSAISPSRARACRSGASCWAYCRQRPQALR